MEILTVGVVAAGVTGSLIYLFRRQAARRFARQERLPAYPPLPATRPREAAAVAEEMQTRFVDKPKQRPFRLLNESEQELYGRLQEAMPTMRIFAQIGISQLAQLRSRSEAQRLLHMASRGVDFLVCDEQFNIIAAIELAWPTPGGDNPGEEEKRDILESMGLPLIIFRPNQLPDIDTISREIAGAIIRRNRLARIHG